MKTQRIFTGAGLYFGIIGSLTSMTFILIFLKDWTNRFQYLSYLLLLPIIILWIAKKRPLAGGLLLIALGAGTLIFDLLFSPAHPGMIAGIGWGYTLVFVTIPLVLSGVFHIVFWRKSR